MMMKKKTMSKLYQIIEKVFILYQSKKKPILSERNLIFWLYNIFARYLYKRQKN